MAKPSVGGYQKQNLSVLLKGMQMHVKGVIAQQLIAVLTAKAQQVVAYIDSGAGIPEYLDGHRRICRWCGDGFHSDKTRCKAGKVRI